MPVEPPGVEQRRHARRAEGPAGAKPGARARAAREPGLHLRGAGRPQRRVMEGRVALERQPVAAPHAEADAGAVGGPAGLAGDLRAVVEYQLVVRELAEHGALLGFERDVAAAAQRHADRRLGLEGTPVE